jgi:hypothetical protein
LFSRKKKWHNEVLKMLPVESFGPAGLGRRAIMMCSKPDSFPESSIYLAGSRSPLLYELNDIFFIEQHDHETVDGISSQLCSITAASHNNKNDHEDTFSMDGFSLPSTSSFKEIESSSLLTAQPNLHLNSTVEVLMTQSDTPIGSGSRDNNLNGNAAVEHHKDPDTAYPLTPRDHEDILSTFSLDDIDFLINETLCSSSNQHARSSGEVIVTQNDISAVPSPLQSPMTQNDTSIQSPSYWGYNDDYVLKKLEDFRIKYNLSFNAKQYRRFIKRRIIRERKEKSNSKQAISAYSSKNTNVLLVPASVDIVEEDFYSESPSLLINEGTSTNMKRKKIYIHESRHQHAINRPRNEKGHFLPKQDDCNTSESKCGIITDRIKVEERNLNDSSLTTTSNDPKPRTYRIEMRWPPVLQQKLEDINVLYAHFRLLRQFIPTIMPSSLLENIESTKEKQEKECDKSIRRSLRLTKDLGGNEYPLLEKDISMVCKELMECREIYLQKGWRAVLLKLKKMSRGQNSKNSDAAKGYVCYNCRGKMKNTCQYKFRCRLTCGTLPRRLI